MTTTDTFSLLHDQTEMTIAKLSSPVTLPSKARHLYSLSVSHDELSIVAPTQCSWGKKAFTHYLGSDESTWAEYDTCVLLSQATVQRPILIDQGTADNFLEEQLKTYLIKEASDAANYPIEVRMQEGYDHSYYFIASFIESHLAFHAKQLSAI